MSKPEPPQYQPQSPDPINPYSPSVVVEPFAGPPGWSEPPRVQLYSVAAITLAGFLGAFFSAAVLVSLNYLRLRKTIAGIAIFVVGIAAFAANFILAMILPEDSPDWPFYIAHTALSFVLAILTQPALLREHQLRGGKLASLWWAVGISIAISLVQVVAFLIVIEVFPDKYLGM
jgi:uncharacterized membrane protein